MVAAPPTHDELPPAKRPKLQVKRWAAPTTASGEDAAPLTAQQVESWASKGFAVVDEVIPQDLVLRCKAECAAIGREGKNIGGFGAFVFPCIDASLVNDLALHPRLIAACSQLLGTDDVRLTQADVHSKKGTAPPWNLWENQDQRIHCDYPNHSLVHPPMWDEPECVSVILYMDEVEVCGGATALVPREGPQDEAYKWPILTPGAGTIPWINNRVDTEAYVEKRDAAMAGEREAMYNREVYVKYRPGTVLLYRHDTWHRGTPVNEGATRWAMNLVYKKPNTDWFGHWHEGWARHMYFPENRVRATAEPEPQFSSVAKLLARASVRQRGVLGFPLPGHKYWTEMTLRAVRARYSPLGLDMTPYEEAFKKRSSSTTSGSDDVETLREELRRLRAEVASLRC
eukprot:TRINITY_DN32412_c0_g2_i1.p1 TRINITY_DN32412_c0_g2~~TRINITY_DN32412_c0_g2_i1.p1  ORF type:complete len:399 (+),score=57.23 TRINITY_DN32412_c0_g2_i1:157-1353(+)